MRNSNSNSTPAQDLIRQASQLRRLERGQTPLLTTTTTTEEEDDDEDDMKLPAAMLDGNKAPPDRSVAGRTPGSVGAASAVTRRDELGLNSRSNTVEMMNNNNNTSSNNWTTGTGGGDDHSVGGSTFASMSIRDLARHERRAAKRARAELEAALAALPSPQFEYELAAPAAANDDDDATMLQVETTRMDDEVDRADLEAAELEKQRLEAEKLYEARNSVVKRKELPRPPVTALAAKSYAAVQLPDKGSLITDEMRTLLQHDAYAYPVMTNGDNGGKKKKKRKVELMEEVQQPPLGEVALETLPEDALNAAKNLIRQELDGILEVKINAAISDGRASSRDGALVFLAHENARVSAEGATNMVYVPDRGGWVEAASDEDRIESLRHEFSVLQEATSSMKKKNDKITAKLAVTNGGYSKRADKFRDDILQTYADLQNAKIEETVYRTLQSHETQGGTNRIERLKTQIKALRAAEAGLQKRYGDLVVEKRRLQVTSGNRDVKE